MVGRLAHPDLQSAVSWTSLSLTQLTALVSSVGVVDPLVICTPLDASPAFGETDPSIGSRGGTVGCAAAAVATAALFDGNPVVDGNPVGPRWSLDGPLWSLHSSCCGGCGCGGCGPVRREPRCRREPRWTAVVSPRRHQPIVVAQLSGHRPKVVKCASWSVLLPSPTPCGSKKTCAEGNVLPPSSGVEAASVTLSRKTAHSLGG